MWLYKFIILILFILIYVASEFIYVNLRGYIINLLF